MAPWLIGYGMFLVWIFTICAATLGISTTVWGFAVTFAGCTVAALGLWWQDEHRWRSSLPTPDLDSSVSSTGSHAMAAATQDASQHSPRSHDWLPLEDDDFDLLETYTQDLTERVEAVYPLVERDHIHKIVWSVMIELFCKRMTASSHNTTASVIAAKMARAA